MLEILSSSEAPWDFSIITVSIVKVHSTYSLRNNQITRVNIVGMLCLISVLLDIMGVKSWISILHKLKYWVHCSWSVFCVMDLEC